MSGIGPNRQLPQCSDSVAIRAIADAAATRSRLRDQGNRDEAHDLLAPVYGWFTEGFEPNRKPMIASGACMANPCL